jgi:uncharacterized integral membrane protein
MNAKLIGTIVLLALLVIFAIQNYQPVTVKVFFWAYETSMLLVILVSFLIGGLAGGLGMWFGGAKKPPSPPPPAEE